MGIIHCSNACAESTSCPSCCCSEDSGPGIAPSSEFRVASCKDQGRYIHCTRDDGYQQDPFLFGVNSPKVQAKPTSGFVEDVEDPSLPEGVLRVISRLMKSSARTPSIYSNRSVVLDLWDLGVEEFAMPPRPSYSDFSESSPRWALPYSSSLLEFQCFAGSVFPDRFDLSHVVLESKMHQDSKTANIGSSGEKEKCSDSGSRSASDQKTIHALPQGSADTSSNPEENHLGRLRTPSPGSSLNTHETNHDDQSVEHVGRTLHGDGSTNKEIAKFERQQHDNVLLDMITLQHHEHAVPHDASTTGVGERRAIQDVGEEDHGMRVLDILSLGDYRRPCNASTFSARGIPRSAPSLLLEESSHDYDHLRKAAHTHDLIAYTCAETRSAGGVLDKYWDKETSALGQGDVPYNYMCLRGDMALSQVPRASKNNSRRSTSRGWQPQPRKISSSRKYVACSLDSKRSSAVRRPEPQMICMPRGDSGVVDILQQCNASHERAFKLKDEPRIGHDAHCIELTGLASGDQPAPTRVCEQDSVSNSEEGVLLVPPPFEAGLDTNIGVVMHDCASPSESSRPSMDSCDHRGGETYRRSGHHGLICRVMRRCSRSWREEEDALNGSENEAMPPDSVSF